MQPELILNGRLFVPASPIKEMWQKVDKHTGASSSEDYVIFKMVQHKHAFEIATKAGQPS